MLVVGDAIAAAGMPQVTGTALDWIVAYIPDNRKSVRFLLDNKSID
jgi:hypothetical protein